MSSVTNPGTNPATKKTPGPVGSPPFPVLTTLILVTGIALVAFGWYALSHWIRGGDDVTWYPPEQECNLHQEGCTATLGDRGKVALKVATDGRIEALDPLPLEVAVQGINARSATVDFIGRGMDMGLNRFPLEADGPNRFSGLGQLGACTREVMPWRARIILETPSGRIGSWFDFDVARSQGVSAGRRRASPAGDRAS